MSRRKKKRGSIFNGVGPLRKSVNKGGTGNILGIAIDTDCGKCDLEIMRFPEPARNECGDCITKWFAYLLHPKVACWIILITAMTTAGLIAAVEECGSTYYVYEPVLGQIGYVKEAVKLVKNVSTDGLKQTCYTSDPNLEYMKKVYSTIQAVMVFMLTMTLGSGISKYKEEIRLFEALAGDVKALAMFLVHMTVDKEKYELKKPRIARQVNDKVDAKVGGVYLSGTILERNTDATYNVKFEDNEIRNVEESDIKIKLEWKRNVQDAYERVRKLLGIVAPVARMVLKGRRLKKGCWNHITCKTETVANRKELETYKNYVKYKPWEKNFFPFKMCPCSRRWLCGYWGDLWTGFGFNCHWWCYTCRRCKADRICGEEHKRLRIFWSDYEKWIQKTNSKNPQEKRCIMQWDEKQQWEKGCFRSLTKKELMVGQGPNLNKAYENWARKLEQHAPKVTDDSLYRKIEQVQESSTLDLFETVMTVLVDELSKIAESKLGFGEDEGAAVRSEIYAKWDSIYASWGSMSSIKSYSEPTIVHLFRFSLLMAYAVLMPYMYLEELKTSIERYLAFVFLEVFVFAFLWYTAYAIRNPFKDVACMRGVKPIASTTQLQVLNLIYSALVFDRTDYKQDDSILKELFKNPFGRREFV
jgi:hypothetical protein